MVRIFNQCRNKILFHLDRIISVQFLMTLQTGSRTANNYNEGPQVEYHAILALQTCPYLIKLHPYQFSLTNFAE